MSVAIKARMASALVAAAALAIAGCGSEALQTAAPPQSVSAATRPVIFNCAGKAQVKPRMVVLACADAGNEFLHLRWSGWGDATATAVGDEVVETCTPSCVAGGTKSYRVRVTVKSLALEGTRTSYTSLTYRFLAKKHRSFIPQPFVLTAAGPQIQDTTAAKTNTAAAVGPA